VERRGSSSEKEKKELDKEEKIGNSIRGYGYKDTEELQIKNTKKFHLGSV
jgi:hypothetical protein